MSLEPVANMWKKGIACVKKQGGLDSALQIGLENDGVDSSFIPKQWRLQETIYIKL